MLKIQVGILIQLARKNQIPGVFITCMGMSGNGFKITGMKTTKTLLRMEVPGKTKKIHIGSLVGGAGIAMRICAVQLADSGAILRIILVIWDLDF
jgi:hypothetical protein